MSQRNSSQTPMAVVNDALSTSFLSLAPEIRNTVYESALLPAYRQPRTYIQGFIEPPILYTCQQVREEGLKMFWSQPLKLFIRMPRLVNKRYATFDNSLKCFRHLAHTGRLSLIRDIGVTVWCLHWKVARLLLLFLEIIRNNETVRINYNEIGAHWRGAPFWRARSDRTGEKPYWTVI